MVHVDLGELLDAVLQGVDPVAAVVGVAQVLEDRKPAVVARDRQRLVSALTFGEAREIDDAEVVLRLLQLFEHGGAIHARELQAAGERGDPFVAPQMQRVRREQNGLPRGPSGVQGRFDLDDVERRDRLEEQLRPGVVNLVHRRVVLRELGVEPIPGLEEIRDRAAERGLASERQHGLVDQDVETVQDGPPGRDDAVPQVAEIHRRHTVGG